MSKLPKCDNNLDNLRQENGQLKSRVDVAENTSKVLSNNLMNINEKVGAVERQLHKMKQYSHRECNEILGIPSNITNILLEKHIILIFEKISTELYRLDIADCHKIGDSEGTIAKLLNQKDCKKILENKSKFKNVNIYKSTISLGIIFFSLFQSLHIVLLSCYTLNLYTSLCMVDLPSTTTILDLNFNQCCDNSHLNCCFHYYSFLCLGCHF